jgi:hypothetical protein
VLPVTKRWMRQGEPYIGTNSRYFNGQRYRWPTVPATAMRAQRATD